MVGEGSIPPLSARRRGGASSTSQSKRQFKEEGKSNMEAEVDPEIVQQLKMQIALLQDQLAHITKNVNN